jgi:hypothetical protein
MKRVVCFALCMSFPSLASAQDKPDAAPRAYGYPPAQPGYAYPPPHPGYGYPLPYGYPPPPPGFGYPPPAPPPSNLAGLTLVAGLGFGQPFGDVDKSATNDMRIGKTISGQFPLLLGAGYRPIPLFSFGMTVQYAPLSTNSCAPASCSATDTRVGGEVRFHILSDRGFSPWISAGYGYEWFTVLASYAGMSDDVTFTGWDFDFEVGGDIRVTPFLTLGPYFGVRIGTYDHGKESGDGTSVQGDVDLPESYQTTHGWWTFGVRGAFTLLPI